MKNQSGILAAFIGSISALAAQETPKSLIFSGNFQNGAFESLTFVNNVVGWDTFFNAGFRGGSTVIGNVEAGHIWYGHEAFTRPPSSPTSLFTHNNTAPGALDALDFHATTVGHVLAGSGYFEQNGQGFFSNVGLGMAPAAKLVSGAIATGFSSNPALLGSFSVTQSSVVSVYEDFFTGANLGAGVAKPDVINSSWGFSDPAATVSEILAIDGLTRENASVAFVTSAGNGGLGTPISAPGSGFNSIAVGSLGGASFLTPSDFSSSGLVDFFNPETGQTSLGVRTAVDISAPGERLFLAAYLGNSGSLGAALPGSVVEPSPSNQYFVNQDGTSYSAPIVAGGIALLKDVAKTDAVLNHVGNDDAFDSRVIESVLMASAQKTEGWENGQDAANRTTQGLDTQTGAGSLDLNNAANVYFLGTRELAADGGGAIAASGWDAGTINLGETFEYVLAVPFTETMTLSVALNWFSVRSYDEVSGAGADIAFSNLDLEVWTLDGMGQFLAKVGESVSDFNNTEFLRFDSLEAGSYGFRVMFNEVVFDLSDSVTSEYYGLAWNALPIPEPSTWLMTTAAGLLLLRRKRS